MNDEVRDIMLQHLKDLQTSVESCSDKDLFIITQAMVLTADFLQKHEKV